MFGKNSEHADIYGKIDPSRDRAEVSMQQENKDDLHKFKKSAFI
jgi:hypothetical protein